jgi:hypothetical protein
MTQIHAGMTQTGIASSVKHNEACAAGVKDTNGGVTGSVTQFVIVPETATIALAGIGITMAGWSVWKRRRIGRGCRPW